MIPDDIQALALADAIGALDPDERRHLQARVATLPSNVREEVALLYDASVEIAASVISETPSPAVRDALLTKITAPSNHTITATDGAWIESAVPGVRMKIRCTPPSGSSMYSWWAVDSFLLPNPT